jgi:hypothetical protein
MITIFKIFESIKTVNPIIVYHGSYQKHDFTESGDVYNGTFFSTSKSEAQSYGKYLYEVTLKPGLNIFDTSNLDDNEQLLNSFNELYDDYFQKDESEYCIDTPQKLFKPDNWNPIERTDGVLDWLNNRYDGVIVFEGGVRNVLLFNPIQDKIKTKQLL